MTGTQTFFVENNMKLSVYWHFASLIKTVVEFSIQKRTKYEFLPDVAEQNNGMLYIFRLVRPTILESENFKIAINKFD